MTEEVETTMEDAIKQWNEKSVEMFLEIRQMLLDKGLPDGLAIDVAKSLTPKSTEIIAVLLAQTIDLTDWESELPPDDQEYEKAYQEFEEELKKHPEETGDENGGKKE